MVSGYPLLLGYYTTRSGNQYEVVEIDWEAERFRLRAYGYYRLIYAVRWGLTYDEDQRPVWQRHQAAYSDAFDSLTYSIRALGNTLTFTSEAMNNLTFTYDHSTILNNGGAV